MSPLSEHIQKFLPYLEYLRVKLYHSALVFIVVFIVGFFSSGFILDHFFEFFRLDGVTIATTSPFQFADLAMDIGFFLGLLCTLPIVAYFMFSFLMPALNARERRMVLVSVPVSILLFVVGFLYGFFILYYSFGLLAQINRTLGIQNIWDVSAFLSQLFLTASLLGVVFEFPVIVTALVRLGALSIETLRSSRKTAVFILFLVVSLLPPTDGVSLVAMALPLVVLYEATLFINRNTHNHVWIRN